MTTQKEMFTDYALNIYHRNGEKCSPLLFGYGCRTNRDINKAYNDALNFLQNLPTEQRVGVYINSHTYQWSDTSNAYIGSGTIYPEIAIEDETAQTALEKIKLKMEE